MRALSTAATGMMAQQLNVDVIANNIANMTTTGFKRQRAEFADLLYSAQARVGAGTSAEDTRAPTGIHIGSGVRAAGVYRVNEQGSLAQTSNRYDLAIEGRGYFRIQLPGGEEAYTRDGSFQVSESGELVTSEGYRVLPSITVPPQATDVMIGRTGQVQVKMPGETEPQTLGQLELSTFVNDAGLEAIGGNMLRQSAASGDAINGTPGEEGFGLLSQGFLESSNVSAVAEMTELIKGQRAYDLNSRVVKAADEMLQTSAMVR
ncbi:flagellar basal-body rod protein FlgG [Sandaracinobacteroides saxicola]|uniref:Flagellar basal-body rod protein FlgG n=1 Tax=Sandaracinobacteroides saxicola TaxID=2759707 RepID=A0A7G5IK16_9SPHN|nr:flagellar basal-body rod protein FlgG [Sandaracinobacteroides saxicola]QMW23708.1 flagellar basal-body rod protein FlgG [Sandaracinobacteroides saxicola]